MLQEDPKPLDSKDILDELDAFFSGQSPDLVQGTLVEDYSDEAEERSNDLMKFQAIPRKDSFFQRKHGGLDIISSILEDLKLNYEYNLLENFEPTFCDYFTQETLEGIAWNLKQLTGTGFSIPSEKIVGNFEGKNGLINLSYWSERVEHRSGYPASHVLRAVARTDSYLLSVDGITERLGKEKSRMVGFQLMLQRLKEDFVDAVLIIDATPQSERWKNVFLFAPDADKCRELTDHTSLVGIRNGLVPGSIGGGLLEGQKV